MTPFLRSLFCSKCRQISGLKLPSKEGCVKILPDFCTKVCKKVCKTGDDVVDLNDAKVVIYKGLSRSRRCVKPFCTKKERKQIPL